MERIDINVPTENEFKETLRPFFSENGFTVADIPHVPDCESADFVLDDGSSKILLELKIKGEDCEEAETRSSILEAGEVYQRSESSLRRNRISALIRKAAAQLQKTPLEADFRIVWFHCAGRYGQNHETRAVATLYGRRMLIHTEKKLKDYWGYYFDNSDFFAFRDTLSACVVSWSGRCQLCINDLHEKADLFRKSNFRKIFNDGYIDPAEFEQEGEAYIVDGNVDRTNEQSIHSHLMLKYNCGKLLDLDLTMHSAEIIAASKR